MSTFCYSCTYITLQNQTGKPVIIVDMLSVSTVTIAHHHMVGRNGQKAIKTFKIFFTFGMVAEYIKSIILLKLLKKVAGRPISWYKIHDLSDLPAQCTRNL